MSHSHCPAHGARQLAEARDWWRANRDKAPDAVDEELARILVRLEERPEFVGRPIEQDLAVRRVYLKRIRYYLYFRVVDDGARVEILALWHGSRRGGPEL